MAIPLTSRQRLMITIVLAGVTSLGPIAMSLVLPALPAIMDSFGAGVGAVQLSTGAYVLGLSLGQIPFGPLADRFGRKPLIVFGLVVFLICTVAMIFTTSFTEFMVLRFVQGLANASFFILARSIVRDLFDREQAAKTFGLITMTVGGSTALSPLAGSAMLNLFGWPSIFVLLAIYCAAFLIVTLWNLPETLESPDADATRLRLIARNIAVVSSHRVFIAYVAVQISLAAGLHAFVAASAPVFIGDLGQIPAEYAIVTAIVFGMVMLGGGILSSIVERVGMIRVLFIAVVIAAVASVAMGAVAVVGVVTIVSITIPMCFFMLGLSLCTPNTQAGAMSPFPHIAGTASAMLGFTQQLAAAVVAVLLGIFADGTATPMVITIGAAGIIGLLAFLLLVRPLPAVPRTKPEPA